MKHSEIQTGMKVRMPSPCATLPRRRRTVVGVVLQKIHRPSKLVKVWARNIEDKDIAGWHSAGELNPVS